MNKPLFEITVKKQDGTFEPFEELYYISQLPPKHFLLTIENNVYKILDIIFKTYSKSKITSPSVSNETNKGVSEQELVLAELIVEEYNMYTSNVIDRIEPRLEKTKFQSSSKINITEQ